MKWNISRGSFFSGSVKLNMNSGMKWQTCKKWQSARAQLWLCHCYLKCFKFIQFKIMLKKLLCTSNLKAWEAATLLNLKKRGETFGQFRFLVIFKAQEASWEMANNLFGRNSTWPAKFLLFQSETLEGYFLDIDCQ